MAKKYRLMHKNIPVSDMELDEASYTISAVGPVYNSNHVPLGIPVKKGAIDRASLNEWWKGRAIPASRIGINNALMEMDIPNTQILPEKCMGLSLSDQYWICPDDSEVRWEEINFFENLFSDDIGNILFGKKASNKPISLMSPDNTSDGWLKKKWKIIDKKHCLIKSGSGATQQEPYNEVFASKIMERLGISHIPYTLLMQEDFPYSTCEDFITPHTELISAWYVMQTMQKSNHVSVYQHYVECCNALGIPDIIQSIDHMLVLDYLIVNEDRHQNNFGVIRNAETLEYLGAAPIYDSGTSLWFDKPTAMIGTNAKLTCKPFKSNHEEQIKLVTSFEWLDISKLKGIEEEWRELVRGSVFIDDKRCDAVCFALQKRVEMMIYEINSHVKLFAVDEFASDVKEDIAYSGAQQDNENTMTFGL